MPRNKRIDYLGIFPCTSETSVMHGVKMAGYACYQYANEGLSTKCVGKGHRHCSVDECGRAYKLIEPVLRKFYDRCHIE
jgi:hypothetical protein